MPFVLLVLALLGGSLICLLVINTTLGAASFRIGQLQKTGTDLTTQLQGLRQRVAAAQAPAEIARRAYQLGMRTQAGVTILDLRTHQIYLLTGQSGVGVQLGASATPSAAASPGTTNKAGAGKSAAGTQPVPTASPAASGTPAPTTSTPNPARSGR
jgi:hypothetical protein